MINRLSDDLDFSHWDNKLGPEGVGGVTWLFVLLMLATSVLLKHWHWYNDTSNCGQSNQLQARFKHRKTSIYCHLLLVICYLSKLFAPKNLRRMISLILEGISLAYYKHPSIQTLALIITIVFKNKHWHSMKIMQVKNTSTVLVRSNTY